MSTPSTDPISTEPGTQHSSFHPARFATRWPQPSTAVITVHGELDASNALEFVEYPLRHAAHTEHLVLDLSGLDFFGTAGFSALHTINVRCAGDNVGWALVPGAAVTRLLRICDPDSALPICHDVEAALSSLHGEPQRLLQLVAQSR